MHSYIVHVDTTYMLIVISARNLQMRLLQTCQMWVTPNHHHIICWHNKYGNNFWSMLYKRSCYCKEQTVICSHWSNIVLSWYYSFINLLTDNMNYMCLSIICTPLSAPSTYLVYRWLLIHLEFENLLIELHFKACEEKLHVSPSTCFQQTHCCGPHGVW